MSLSSSAFPLLLPLPSPALAYEAVKTQREAVSPELQTACCAMTHCSSTPPLWEYLELGLPTFVNITYCSAHFEMDTFYWVFFLLHCTLQMSPGPFSTAVYHKFY